MSRKSSLFAQVLAALSLIGAGLLSLGSTATAHAQATPRITGQAENSPLVSLHGAVHPWARPEFDRGPAPSNLSGRMLLVLKRSPEQESALQALIASQQDPHSPNYHKWLTPEDFGKRFGVADSDVQTVTSYLSSQGMSVGRVYGSHMAVEVGATAGQIRSTFQTEIHAYSVAGKTFYANNSAPKIPSALHTVVSGFSALNNFRLEGGSGAGRQAAFDPATHSLKPLFTTTNSGTTVYGVSPADLGVIYGVPAATAQGQGGKNVNVGIIGDSDINVNYVNNYRTTFGLGTNPPVVVVDGNDPGANDDAYIAYKQIELVSAVAPNATIYYYTSATTDYDSGIYFALLRAVADNQVQVLLNGFQSCETAIGDGAMEMVNDAAEQAAAQGITFVAASGNTGAAGCEVPGAAGSATSGFAVNGFASSPYLTAVGGTDFFYGSGAITTYWSATNTGYASALKYIPEQVWNDSYGPGGAGTSYSASSTPSVELASGGGPSTAGLDGISTPNPIPSYQSGDTNAAAIGGTARVIPDVSFFAGSGNNNSEGYNNTAYMFCMASTDCLSTGTPQFTYSGGTEASSAVFAGAVALALNYYDQQNAAALQANGTTRFGLGNVNPALYSQFSTIISHDITRGTNELACTGSNNCINGTMTGYAAQTGYDAATGLGSFDIGSFTTLYKPSNTTSSSVTLTVTDLTGNALPSCVVGGVTEPHCTTHSNWLKFVVAASSSSGTPTGDVGIFTSSPLADSAVERLTLSGGTASDNWNLLPGGTYNLYARYAGDSTYAPSVTATPYNITVQQEACQIVVYGHNINVGSTTNIPYGTPVSITVEPYSAASTLNVGIPSGSIKVTDNGAFITTLPIDSQGAATLNSNLLSQGSHSITLTYPGDASFSSCQTGPYLANVTPAATITTLNAPDTQVYNSTAGIPITAIVQSATTPSNGTAPAGSVTFNTATPQTVTLIPGFDPSGNAIATASITIGTADIPASGQINAVYTPSTSSYLPSSSLPVMFTFRKPHLETPSSVTFTITDKNGTYATGGSLSFPAEDSLTLNISVIARKPDQSYLLIYANGVLLCSPQGIQPSSSGTASFTLPQRNGYLNLPSGLVQLSVVYAGWTQSNSGSNGVVQSEPASSSPQITIVDDRTSADFSLQSDTTVNQGNPLLASTSTTTASYNLRLTSIYNFQSAYGTTPINLSCNVVGYSVGGVRSTPAGLTCGFGSLSTSTTSVTLGSTGYASTTVVVGAASGFSVAGNTTPAQPASRWWMAGGGATLACIFLLGLPARRRKWQTLLGACVMVIVSFGMSGCGVNVASGPGQQYYGGLNGGASGGAAGSPLGTGTPVPAGTYTVLVTATTTTNTTLTHTLPVQVLVGTTN
ncbi:MAG TPA: protease pro-enzyme activation domain-containing protein [Acidobacteriaceae bacterium]|nr:protease pro-enzyme activation domain-containing protein [Acidobacteriaceae bacterium]